MAAWLTGGKQITSQLPALAAAPPGEPPISIPAMPFNDGDSEPVISFPQIDIAARDLAKRRVMTRADFDALSTEAKRTAFTVAKVTSLDALSKLQDVLSKDVEEGRTLVEFRAKVGQMLGESALSPAHIENVYRTNIAAAYAEGQRQVLSHPLVADEFPYVEYSATHDERTREEHMAMEHHGIGGSAIYRMDDPVVQLFWAPWDFQCRCVMIPLTLEDAAAEGIKEAQDWLETGDPPAKPAYVQMPPFQPPKGFGNKGHGLGV